MLKLPPAAAAAALAAVLPGQGGLLHDPGWLPEPVGTPLQARFADVDADGFQDLVRLHGRGVEVLRQDPATGRFTRTEHLILVAGSAPPLRALAVGRLDASQDAYPDLAVLSGSGEVDILRSDGVGGLVRVQPRPIPVLVSASGVDVLAGDLDGDGRDDLIVLLEAVPPQYLLAQPGGVFVDVTAARMPSIGYARPHAALADVDGDLDPDLVLCSTNNLPARLLRNVSGTFVDVPGAFGVSGIQAGSLLAIDLQGSPLPEIVFGRAGNAYLAPEVRTNSAGTFSSTGLPQSLRVRGVLGMAPFDADSDGLDDVLFLETDGALGFALRGNGVLVGHPVGSGGNTEPIPLLPADPGRTCFALGDLEGDGDVDLSAGGDCPEALLLRDAGQFCDVERLAFPSKWHAEGYVGAAVDLDGNGDPDLLGLHPGGDWIAFDNDGSGRFERTAVSIPALASLPAAAGWDRLAVISLVAPGRRDLIALNRRSGTVPELAIMVHAGGAWLEETSTRFAGVASGLASAVAAYPAGTGVDDLVLGTTSGEVEHHRNLGGVLVPQPGAFPANLQLGQVGSILVADFTGDGRPDVLALPDSASASPRLLVAASQGFTSAPAVPGMVRGNRGVVSDLDLDGDLDVLLRVNGQPGVTALRWTGGAFTAASLGGLTSVNYVVEDMAVVRVDGVPRIVLARNGAADAELVWNGSGYSSQVGIPPRGPLASTGLLAADVDRDDDVDLLVFREHHDPVVLRNATVHLQQLGPLASGRSGEVLLRAPEPQSLAVVAFGPRLDTLTPWGLLRLDPAALGSLFLGVAPQRTSRWSLSSPPGLPRIRLPLQAAWFTPGNQVRLSGLAYLTLLP